MKRLIILRGVPGSGKSTVAGLLTRGLGTNIICSADSYFMQGGKYDFDASKLGEAHGYCRNRARLAMVAGTETVVIDNTNIAPRAYKDYLQLARLHGYEVHILRIDETDYTKCAKRQTHGVPFQTIQRMGEQLYDVRAL